MRDVLRVVLDALDAGRVQSRRLSRTDPTVATIWGQLQRLTGDFFAHFWHLPCFTGARR